MKLIDQVRQQLDSVEATNASKIYTPFTLFCVFFAIYFNADILGSIFLSDNWAVKSAALESLADRSWDVWFYFAFRVICYSLGMMIFYGLAQAGAAFVWGMANWANTALSSFANRSKFIAKSEFDRVSQEANTLRQHEKELYSKIAEYHTWEPEDINRLSSDLASSQESYSNTLQKLELSERTVRSLKNDINVASSENDIFASERSNFLGQIKKDADIISFFNGYTAFLNEQLFEIYKGADFLSENDIKNIFDRAFQQYDITEELNQITQLSEQRASIKGLFSYKFGLAIGAMVYMHILEIYVEFDEYDSTESLVDVAFTRGGRAQLLEQFDLRR